ncbi:hypothetical protein HELRODRAFT_143679, partial [Helobdella robusta]|uniref:Uncharacterized protein n=1 Tax=Helobdella robusta TaxID=6412 RepID=T1EJB8_HELRO
NIVSVNPVNEKIFLNVCKDLDIDLISFDLTQRLPFIPKRTAINLAMQKGISFELNIEGMMRDHTTKRNVISNASILVELCHGRNIVLSNGSRDVFHLRGPYDLINVAYLFGLNKEEARNSLTTNPSYMLKHSLARKYVKSVV